MPEPRSRITTHGHILAGAFVRWRTGVKDTGFGKPFVATANSFDQFVPEHLHIEELGQLVARKVGADVGQESTSTSWTRWSRPPTPTSATPREIPRLLG